MGFLSELFLKRALSLILVLSFLTPSVSMMNGAGSSASVFPISPYYVPETLFDVSGVLNDPAYRADLKRVGFSDDFLPALYLTQRPDGYGVITDFENGSMDNAYHRLDKAFEQAFYRNRAKLYVKALFQNSAAYVVLPALLSGVFVGVYFSTLDPMFFLGALLAYQIVYFICMGIQGDMPLLMTGFWPSNDPLTKRELAYFKKKYMVLFQKWQKQSLTLFEERDQTTFLEDRFMNMRIAPTNTLESLKFIDRFLSLPLRSKMPSITANLEAYVHFYAPQDREVLLREVEKHRARFQDALGTNQKPYRPFIYMLSPHGTGKNWAVEKMAKALGLELTVVNLKGLQTKEDIFGSQDKPGALLEAFLRCTWRNGIFFFDEFDKASHDVIDHLLPLLDPQNACFYSDYLGLDIDLSHVLFIFAANKNIDHEALQDRFQEEHTAFMRIEDAQKVVDALYQGSSDDIKERLLEKVRKKAYEKEGKTYYTFRGASSLLHALQGISG